ncbi:MAG: sensor histidine kinase [Oscillospiraceae bacterium]
MNSCKSGPARFKEWVSGSIRRKLTVFVVMLCLLLVSLFWVFSVSMLQPSYNRLIRRDLGTTLSALVNIFNKAEAAGYPLYTSYVGADGSVSSQLSVEVLQMLQQAQENGEINLGGRCLDIANEQKENLFLVDGLSPRCLLHQGQSAVITADGYIYSLPEPNGALVSLLRKQVLDEGGLYLIIEGSQMVLGSPAASGRISIIITANLERIPQAVSVLKGLLLPVSIMLVLFSASSAWVFSLWFTRPINRLSGAARQMSKGNYDVSVRPVGDDEIATLARDFNIMAKEVKRSAELQRDLIANVSHDLRTPLTLIKGYAETVRDLTGNDAEKRTEQLSVIVDETDRLSALVNSVMELSRMSSGNEKLNPVRFSLYQLCDEVSFRYDAVCQQKGYQFDFGGDESCYIVADPAQIERALHNLLGNALNHIGADGYIGLHVFKTQAGSVRVEVADHGPGVPAKDLPYLFDRYYRSRSDSGKQGTGLGLSITKAIFNAHNFTYGVESTEGAGAIFWFEAPAAPPERKNTGRFHTK